MKISASEFLRLVMDDDNLDENERVCLTVNRRGHFHNHTLSDRVLASVQANPEPWYFCVSTVTRPPRGQPPHRRVEDLQYAMCLVLDDVGTKASEPPVPPSWKLWSSRGNAQWGYLLEAHDVSHPEGAEHYDACVRGLALAGYSDAGAQGAYRVMRVPGSLHRSGFISTVWYWHPTRVWVLDELMREMGVEPSARRVKAHAQAPGGQALADVVDPVLDWLRDTGRLLGGANDRFVHVVCPWAHEHSDGRVEAGYSPLGYGTMRVRGFSCLHEHCAGRSIGDLLAVWEKERRIKERTCG